MCVRVEPGDMKSLRLFGTAQMSKRRLATEVAAVCAFSAIAHNDRVGMIAMSDEVENVIPPQKGRKHGMRVLREILEAQPRRRGTDLNCGLETLFRVAKRRTVTFLLSDFFAEDYERTLALAAAKHDLIPIVLSDPRDEDLPDVGLCRFEDLETGQDFLVDTSSRKVREYYKKETQARRAEQQRTFRKFGLDHAVVSTDKPYMPELRSLFARRARKAYR